MPNIALHCDQAVFTSVRTPMGEGYRIIAASKGLKPEEKQTITRNAPSHESLCFPGDGESTGPLAAAFYPLKSGRRCVSMSCYAGTEHTGRGGQRVYTHVVAFDESDLARCGFNPLRILRALVISIGSEPQLHPEPVLPELELLVEDKDHLDAPALSTEARMGALHAMLVRTDLVIAMKSDWLATTEALLLGLPGTMRADVSFGAGLHFSLTRLHRLNVLSDDQGKAKRRTTGQPVAYLDAESAEALSPVDASSWLTFVERHYAAGDMDGLRRRTSRAYENTTLAGCNRIGDIFETINQLPRFDCRTLLGLASEHFAAGHESAVGEAYEELAETLKRLLPLRLDAASWEEVCSLWDPILALWRQPGEEAEFAQVLLRGAALRIARQDPVQAATLTVEMASEVALHSQAKPCDVMIDEILSRLLSWMRQAEDSERAEVVPVVRLWREARPNCETVTELCVACEDVPVNSPAP